MPAPRDRAAEWLEADGLGGFASGTVGGARTRRYHALLLPALTPPTGRVVLVNGMEAWVERDGVREALSTQHYLPDTRHPDGETRLVDFRRDPWPTWRYRLADGTELEHELFAVHGRPQVILAWRVAGPAPRGSLRLIVRPFLSGRDYHGLQHENGAFRFDAAVEGYAVTWRPYEGLPAVRARSNGVYRQDPSWYRSVLYAAERARGLDDHEDLASPGEFVFDLARDEALWTLEAETSGREAEGGRLATVVKRARAVETRRREGFDSPLHRAADAYLVERGSGQTIVAGYPWFTDWGRDTFIALRGVCLAAGRLAEAEAILLEWAGAVSEGMLPNRFPDRGDMPEFNAVDASLWYVVAVHDYLLASRRARRRVGRAARSALLAAVEAILEGYAGGTRYGIRMDADGLLAAGVPGVQLTWMDAKVGDWVVTPRIGKPVEVQALWLNALRIGAAEDTRWEEPLARGTAAFAERFWHPDGYLHDVVDPDHRPGAADGTFRPNQIFAVGGLPYPVLELERGRAVVDAVEARLLTPLGLRSLAPGAPGYAPRYAGGVLERDGAYHQGTVWPWLLGPFVEAWVRVRGGTAAAKREARARFLEPLLAHLDEAGVGHISEVADAEAPHTPGGCPFQAWSVGEALRLDRVVLAPAKARARRVQVAP